MVFLPSTHRFAEMELNISDQSSKITMKAIEINNVTKYKYMYNKIMSTLWIILAARINQSKFSNLIQHAWKYIFTFQTYKLLK